MNKAKIAVLVSGGGTNLQALIDYTKTHNANFEIAVVISNKENAYALERANKENIPTKLILRNSVGAGFHPCPDEDETSSLQQKFEARIISTLNDYNIDLIVLAGFMSILSESFTSKYPEKIINVHPSLIPSFCGKGYYGLKVHEAALNYGVKVTGATVHFVNEIPDGGKIILQKAVEIQEGDTPEILQKRVMEQAEWVILPEAVNKISYKILSNETT